MYCDNRSAVTMPELKSTEDFIADAMASHEGDKYDYSEVKYVNNKTKVAIICKGCGRRFMQLPNNHLSGHGCSKCSNRARARDRTLTPEQALERFHDAHKDDDQYDYSEVAYVNYSKKVRILCCWHGAFMITPSDFIEGKGCKHCAIERKSKKFSKGLEKFIEEGIDRYEDRFTYEKTKYVNAKAKMIITCRLHGDFQTTADKFLNAVMPCK